MLDEVVAGPAALARHPRLPEERPSKTVLNVVDGKTVPADRADDRPRRPRTGEVFAAAPVSGPPDVDRACAAAADGVRDAGATPRRASASGRC